MFPRISVISNSSDAANYFKGLIFLVCQEKVVSQNEMMLLRKVGTSLGFNNSFIEKTVDELLQNNSQLREPPIFSNCSTAEIFLKDGIKLAFADKVLSLRQIEWLMATALKNKLSRQWVFIELENILEFDNVDFNGDFECQKNTAGLQRNDSFIRKI